MIEKNILEKANKWLSGSYDEETKTKIKDLIENNPKELIDSFYKDLEFGTGGLRGIMGPGTNRMNIYTVGIATQGLSNYIKKSFNDLKEIKVAIAFDSRNNSQLFAKTAANIFSANGFTVYLFNELKPTPELSFAIRELGCQSGIVITASHNPKEYNGYKAYWDDGAQVIAPHDTNIINEVNKISDISEVNYKGDNSKIIELNDDFDNIYINKICNLSVNPKIIKSQNDLKIVYTPIHGTGTKLVPKTLKKLGFTNVFTVNEQDIPNGDFPTVLSPNPEEKEALALALKMADTVGAELVMATDPDADRVGIAIRDNNNKLILLNGNQTASMLVNYMLDAWKNNNKITGKEYIVKTIVTTNLLADIAKEYNVNCYETLTGFKFIAEVIRNKEGKEKFIVGGEESYGYLIGDFVRDKDAVASCAMIAEMAAFAKYNKLSLFDYLCDIYIKYGFYKEGLISITKKGKEGAELISKIMSNYRNNPLKEIDGSKIIKTIDYLNKEGNFKADVIQFFMEDGCSVTVRPSGTEPKIKYYFGVKAKLFGKNDFDSINNKLDLKIESIIKSMNLR